MYVCMYVCMYVHAAVGVGIEKRYMYMCRCVRGPSSQVAMVTMDKIIKQWVGCVV